MLAYSRKGRVHLDCLLVAVCDYVAGVQYLDRFDYRHYSEMEVIVGNSAHFINPINAKTSTGPPYNMKKYHHYARIGEEAAMSPEMATRVDAIK